jgi:uncharacterized protein (UPF0128 family)
VGRTVNVLKEAITNLIRAVKKMGITTNMQKTKYIKVTKRLTNMRMLRVDDQVAERVREISNILDLL